MTNTSQPIVCHVCKPTKDTWFEHCKHVMELYEQIQDARRNEQEARSALADLKAGLGQSPSPDELKSFGIPVREEVRRVSLAFLQKTEKLLNDVLWLSSELGFDPNAIYAARNGVMRIICGDDNGTVSDKRWDCPVTMPEEGKKT